MPPILDLVIPVGLPIILGQFPPEFRLIGLLIAVFCHSYTRRTLMNSLVYMLDVAVAFLLCTRDLCARYASPTRTECRLRELYTAPSERVLGKVQRSLDEHCRAFLSLSPFFVLASSGHRHGRSARALDCSPKGGAPGFVGVTADGQRLIIPDVSGNNRLDTLSNLAAGTPGSDAVGLLFLVPGLTEILRVNGSAHISEEATLREKVAVRLPNDERVIPKLVIVVTVRECYLHCGKAITRSKLWSDGARVSGDAFPGLARVVCDQLARTGAKLSPGPAVVNGKLDVQQYEKLCAESLQAIAEGVAD